MAWCMEDTLICGFNRLGFEKLVLSHPQIGLQVIKNLSRRITWLTSRVGSMSITNLEDRLHRVLVQVAREHVLFKRLFKNARKRLICNYKFNNH
jgi:CRP-like cAMP-binding protein